MKFLAKNWEMFFTESKIQNKEKDLVDQVSIDVVNKRYLVDESVDLLVTDGCDEEGTEIYSTYVSKEIFDIILQGLKLKGYKENEV